MDNRVVRASAGGREFWIRPTGDRATSYEMPQFRWQILDCGLVEVFDTTREGADRDEPVAIYSGGWSLRDHP